MLGFPGARPRFLNALLPFRGGSLTPTRQRLQASQVGVTVIDARRNRPDFRDRRMAGATGFVPVAFGFGDESERFPADHRASLGVDFPRQSDPARALPS